MDELYVTPNPAKEGGEVAIQGPKNGKVYILAKGKKRKEVQLDANGKAKVPVPVRGGQQFTVASASFEGPEVIVDVVSNSK